LGEPSAEAKLSHAMWLFRQIGKEESLIKREPGSPGLESDLTRFSLSLPWLYTPSWLRDLPVAHTLVGTARQLTHAQLLNSELIRSAATAPVVSSVHDARQADDAIHAAYRGTIPLLQDKHGHQAHARVSEEATVAQRGDCLGAAVAGLVVNRSFAVRAGAVVGHPQPFHRRLSGGQRCQEHRVLHAEGARVGRHLGYTGTDEGFRSGNSDVGLARPVAQHLGELDRSAGAAGIEL